MTSPLTSPRRLNFFGHFSHSAAAKRQALRRKVEQAHEEALAEKPHRDAAIALERAQQELTRALSFARTPALSGETAEEKD